MLFNSYQFIFVFLPIVLIGYTYLDRRGRTESSKIFLVVASFIFYGWWNPRYLLLILGSIGFNYLIGQKIWSEGRDPYRKIYLIVGISLNLLAIGYFKYAGFLASNVGDLLGTDFGFPDIVLPIAISFFTFQQIAFLVDSYQRLSHEYSFVNYCLFVTFFPQLIAGPIVHHREMIPQFEGGQLGKRQSIYFAAGVTLFALGLFKKTVIADTVAQYSSPTFAAADAGAVLTFLEAWGGALSYSFQIYFDFSGYSDMALGLGCMFGIKLPVNFYSPYKASNIIDFWKKWHISLSRFLRDYLYIPLGGNQKGKLRRYINLLTTMLLGGLWHGAGWGFVLWGLMHGVFLCINHGFRYSVKAIGVTINISLFKPASVLLTFVAVTVAWVPFRAESLSGVTAFYTGMLGLNGIALPEPYIARLGSLSEFLMNMGVAFSSVPNFYGLDQGIILLSLLVVIWALPNSIQLWDFQERLQGEFSSTWYKNGILPLMGFFAGSSFFFGLISISRLSEFIYFQF